MSKTTAMTLARLAQSGGTFNQNQGGAADSLKAAREKEIINCRVVRSGKSLIVPELMSFHQAITVLERQIEHEEKITSVDKMIPVFPWEGALALKKAMEERFGLFTTQDTRTMFGSIPPKEMTINISTTETITVPWGQFQWPLAEKNIFDPEHVAEYLKTGYKEHKGRIVFSVQGQIKMKWMSELNDLMKRAEEIAREQSIYQAKAVKIAFTDSEGGQIELPEPEFMDLDRFDLHDIVYTKELEDLIATYIMTPLTHTEACRAAGIPLKRGVLAAGAYGTGKSLLAKAVGKVGVANGWTFLYIKNAAELPEAIRFAEIYQPAVIFAEDVDRATEGEKRTEEIDRILNTLDGIDTKDSEIMVILTTNHVDTINPAMRRPGRLDVVLNITAPDAEAAARLMRIYARTQLAENADLTEVGEMLAGNTPAVLREVIERSKLATIRRTGDPRSLITAEDLIISARAIIQQQELLAVQHDDSISIADAFIEDIAESVANRMQPDLKDASESALEKVVGKRVKARKQ